jgi:hypothetical protein
MLQESQLLTSGRVLVKHRRIKKLITVSLSNLYAVPVTLKVEKITYTGPAQLRGFNHGKSRFSSLLSPHLLSASPGGVSVFCRSSAPGSRRIVGSARSR